MPISQRGGKAMHDAFFRKGYEINASWIYRTLGVLGHHMILTRFDFIVNKYKDPIIWRQGMTGLSLSRDVARKVGG